MAKGVETVGAIEKSLLLSVPPELRKDLKAVCQDAITHKK